MVRVRKKEGLNETVSKMVLEALMIAKKAQPGQFVIVRAKEESERIPLTIADYDRKEGTVTIIYHSRSMSLGVIPYSLSAFAARSPARPCSHAAAHAACTAGMP